MLQTSNILNALRESKQLVYTQDVRLTHKTYEQHPSRMTWDHIVEKETYRLLFIYTKSNFLSVALVGEHNEVFGYCRDIDPQATTLCDIVSSALHCMRVESMIGAIENSIVPHYNDSEVLVYAE